MKKIWFIALASILLGMVSCGEDNPAEDTFYTISFDTDGGTPAPEAQRVKEGDKVTAPSANPAKEGYVFLFWHLSGASAAYNFAMPVTGDMTLTARYEEESAVEYWQVTWNLNGGTWTADDNHAVQVVRGGTLAEPAAPTKAGNTFEGWYREAGLTNKVTFPYDVSTVTGDFTLYAKWTAEGEEEESGTFTSIAALNTWLDAQPGNTVETAYKVKLKGVNLDENNGWGNLGVAIKGVKFVDLDLSGCTGTTIPDGESRINSSIITWTGVFLDCENLTAIKLTPNLVTIGENAFRYCEELVSIALPETLTSIKSDAFYTCSKLESLVLPNGVTTISDDAFAECENLTSIILSKELQTIGGYAFGNNNLSSIIIPEKVTSMGQSIFGGCGSIDIDFEVIMKPTTPPLLEWEEYQDCLGLDIDNANLSFTIKVPAASLNAYKTANGWKYYASIIVAE